ncbi:Mor transcription activator family protein [Pseudoalteromonas sp. MMG012]|uniref:Mor transcription activator family protein n=1 Tax=Pseudoalteromonas sp. MMG012 TaxID=2822686 RepID=UPI001B3A6076|nr:Mor transcription activator family protein [Pseudoalteromonas sp. MMG012]MBQ4852861.1 transcriptional regulator [Pseudoalteromonas sp. MMG012]
MANENSIGKVTDRGDGVLFTIFELVTMGVSEVLDDDEATELGRKVVEKIRRTFAGEQIYICQGRTLEAILLKNAIWSEFRGDNHLELAKKHGCSEQWVYRVVRLMRTLKRDEMQGDLFDDSKGKGPMNEGPQIC